MIFQRANCGNKPFTKDTRNFSDKNAIREMMGSIVNFFSELDYPEEVSIKDLQKMDKQSFVKYFNVISFVC